MDGSHSSSRRSLLSPFLERDPFGHPFFSQPFATLFASHPFGAGFVQQERNRSPVIVEVSDDDVDQQATGMPYSRSNGEPIVEHPDDDDDDVGIAKQHERVRRSRENCSTSLPNSIVHSYSFSSVAYGGPQGTYYTASKTRRAGPDGIVEEEDEERDLRGGKETKRLSRGLGNKGHSVTFKRDTTGENFVETLHNLKEEEKHEFDEVWKKRAEKSLPGWKTSRERLLSNAGNGYARGGRGALPSSNVLGGWQTAK